MSRKIGTNCLGPVFYEFIQRTGKTTYSPKDNLGIPREERILLETAKITELDLKRLEQVLSDCVEPLFMKVNQQGIGPDTIALHVG